MFISKHTHPDAFTFISQDSVTVLQSTAHYQTVYSICICGDCADLIPANNTASVNILPSPSTTLPNLLSKVHAQTAKKLPN